MEPTTEIAEIAFVSDISGVCSSRETRPITPSPTNVDSTSTVSELQFCAVASAAECESAADAPVATRQAAHAVPQRDTVFRTMICGPPVLYACARRRWVRAVFFSSAFYAATRLAKPNRPTGPHSSEDV